MHLPKRFAALLVSVFPLLALVACAQNKEQPSPGSADADPSSCAVAPTLPPLTAEEAVRAYTEAYTRLNRAEHLAFSCTAKVGLNDGRGWSHVTIATEAALTRTGTALSRLLVTGQVSDSHPDGPAALWRYYDGETGRLYTQSGGRKLYTQGADDRQALAGLGLVFPYALSEAALQGLTHTRGEDGAIILEGAVEPRGLGEDRTEGFLDAAFVAFRLAEDLLGDYNLKKAHITAVVGRDGLFRSFRASYEAAIPGAAGDLPMSLELEAAYPHPGQDAAVIPPADLDAYTAAGD